jgi:hypothetical protein
LFLKFCYNNSLFAVGNFLLIKRSLMLINNIIENFEILRKIRSRMVARNSKILVTDSFLNECQNYKALILISVVMKIFRKYF